MSRRTYAAVSHLYRTPTYYSWNSMLNRCLDPRCKDFARYGAVGITVCPQWLDLAVFVADMGLRPSRAYSIDRVKNEKGYEPGNCRWATAEQQQRNKTNNLLVAIDGEQVALAEACERLGLPYGLVHCRIYHHGWKPEDALRPNTRAHPKPSVAGASCQRYHQRTPSTRNKHGFAGVEQHKNGNFCARIHVGGRSRYLGIFPTPDLAHAAYVVARERAAKGLPV